MAITQIETGLWGRQILETSIVPVGTKITLKKNPAVVQLIVRTPNIAEIRTTITYGSGTSKVNSSFFVGRAIDFSRQTFGDFIRVRRKYFKWENTLGEGEEYDDADNKLLQHPLVGRVAAYSSRLDRVLVLSGLRGNINGELDHDQTQLVIRLLGDEQEQEVTVPAGDLSMLVPESYMERFKQLRDRGFDDLPSAMTEHFPGCNFDQDFLIWIADSGVNKCKFLSDASVGRSRRELVSDS